MGNPSRIEQSVQRYSLDALVDAEISAAATDFTKLESLLVERSEQLAALEAKAGNAFHEKSSGEAKNMKLAAKKLQDERDSLLVLVTNARVSPFALRAYIWMYF